VGRGTLGAVPTHMGIYEGIALYALTVLLACEEKDTLHKELLRLLKVIPAIVYPVCDRIPTTTGITGILLIPNF